MLPRYVPNTFPTLRRESIPVSFPRHTSRGDSSTPRGASALRFSLPPQPSEESRFERPSRGTRAGVTLPHLAVLPRCVSASLHNPPKRVASSDLPAAHEPGGPGYCSRSFPLPAPEGTIGKSSRAPSPEPAVLTLPPEQVLRRAQAQGGRLSTA
jgi:hypothetical protein